MRWCESIECPRFPTLNWFWSRMELPEYWFGEYVSAIYEEKISIMLTIHIHSAMFTNATIMTRNITRFKSVEKKTHSILWHIGNEVSIK